MRRLIIAAAVVPAAAATGFAGFSAAGGRADPLPTTNVTVGIREWAFDLSQETAPVGTVVFTITHEQVLSRGSRCRYGISLPGGLSGRRSVHRAGLLQRTARALPAAFREQRGPE